MFRLLVFCCPFFLAFLQRCSILLSAFSQWYSGPVLMLAPPRIPDEDPDVPPRGNPRMQ
jgi:hypothetical protein